MKLVVLKEIIIEVASVEDASDVLDEHAEFLVGAVLEEDLDGTGEPKIVAAEKFVTDEYWDQFTAGPDFPMYESELNLCPGDVQARDSL